MSFTVSITREFTTQRIQDLLCAAFEGGVGHWAKITEYKYPEWRAATDYKHPYFELPTQIGGGVLIGDSTGEEAFEDLWLDIDKCKKGLQIMAEKYPRHFANFDKENEDAETGDVYLQCCLFEEIVFG